MNIFCSRKIYYRLYEKKNTYKHL